MAHSGLVIFMQTVPGKPKHRKLFQRLPCENQDGTAGFVPAGFEWDGSSVPAIFQGLFPRHRHPIASCRHDWRCRNARNMTERKWADQQFKDDVGTTSWWLTKQVGYLGVRIGAFFGVGNRF